MQICHVVEGEGSWEKIKETFGTESELSKEIDELNRFQGAKKAIKVSA